MKLIINKLLARNNISLQNAITKINKNGKKCLIIIDKNKKLSGILTDGDIRHALKNKINLSRSITNIYTRIAIACYIRKIWLMHQCSCQLAHERGNLIFHSCYLHTTDIIKKIKRVTIE